MIRTETVTLSALSATAYRQKLPSGDIGIVILRGDSAQPGLATVSRSTGKAVLAANTPADLYPAEAFAEAIELTYGLPYTKRSAPAAPEAPAEEPAEAEEAEAAEANEEAAALAAAEAAADAVVESEAYRKVVEAYTNKKGQFSFGLLNKDLIKYAHASTRVASMVAGKESSDAICLYAVANRFRAVTKNKELTDEEAAAIIGVLDDVSPKGVLKEFRDSLRQMLRR